MNRIAWLLLAAFVVGAAGSLALVDDNGYVMMHMRGWTVETSVTAFAIALLVMVIVVWLLLGILRGTLRLPGQIGSFVKERRERKAYHGLVDGLRHFVEGDWDQAETELLRRVGDAEDSQVNYLFAAITANRLGAHDRRDNYLRQAAREKKGSELAVLMAQARIQMNNGQDTDALATLTRLRSIAPDHPQVLYRLIRLRERSEDWESLIPLLQETEHARVLSKQDWQDYAVKAWVPYLHDRAEVSLDSLRDAWAETPKSVKRQPEVEAAYVRALMDKQSNDEALKLVINGLKRDWNPELALRFADLQASDTVSQLASVEAWLREYGEKPELLLTAGRLCLRNQLWGRARSYLENCVSTGALVPEAWRELGRLHEAQSEMSGAIEAYRRGMDAAVNVDQPVAGNQRIGDVGTMAKAANG